MSKNSINEYNMKSIKKSRKNRIIWITIIFVVLTLFFTIFLVLNDIANTWKGLEVDLSSPEKTVASLERALRQRSFIMLEEIFNENHYSSIFGEFFFGKDITVWFGYSRDPKVSRTKTISSKDIFRINPYELNYLTEDAALSILVIEEDINGITNYFTAAFLFQRINGDWKITKFYDFIYLESDMIEVKDFILHHINNEFRLRLEKKEIPGALESTILYNFALSIESLELKFGHETLCKLGRESMSIFMRDNKIQLSENNLKNADIIVFENQCNFNDIVSRDRDRKYLIYILIKTRNGEIPIKYYGDLIQ